MSGETETNVSGCTTDTLHSWVIDMLAERDRRFALAIEKLADELVERDTRYQQRFEATATQMSDRDTFLERLAVERALQVKTAFDAAQRASDKADLAYEKRFDGQNEFREQLSDQAATFMPRKEYDAAHASVVDKVNDVILRLGADQGRSTGLKDGWGYLVGGVGAMLGIAGLVIALVK